MELRHIPLSQLDISKLNMRHGRKKPELDDILPSIRQRGVLQPLLVRPVANSEDRFEIVAGRRRYFASMIAAEEAREGGAGDEPVEAEPLPCAIMQAGDDAAALEASLLENLARLPADEITQYECFARLVREGKDADEIAETFGLTRLMVERRLALGNLIPGIKTLWRDEDLDRRSLQHLTMATKAQQQAWLKLHRDPDAYAPRGQSLKDWLFGGETILVSAALFELEAYPGSMVSDLFGEDAYFADPALFWQHQHKAIAEKRDALLAEGWQAVTITQASQPFYSWEYERCSKEDGGTVYVNLSRSGEAEFHKGWITRAEARKRENAQQGEQSGSEQPQNPETTRPLQDYLDLHRLAAVRLSLIAEPKTAFRLMVAHAMASSGHWPVRPEPMSSRKASVAASIEASPANVLFETERQAIRDLIGVPEGQSQITRACYEGTATATIFARLLELDEETVHRIAAFIMAETLQAGSTMVEAAGHVLRTDPARQWQADETFFDLIRDGKVMQALLEDIAGPEIATANVSEKQKVKKKIALDMAEGTNGRAKVEGWLPGWMRFPASAVTEGGNHQTASLWDRVRGLFAQGEPSDEPSVVRSNWRTGCVD